MTQHEEEETVNKLYLIDDEVPTPPGSFIQAYRGLSPLLRGGNLPWQFVLPEKAYKTYQEGVNRFKTLRDDLDLRYLTDVYNPTNKVFDYLRAAKINRERFDRFAALDATGHTSTFSPDEAGFARRVEYTRVGTVTGRLKTTGGPTLMHLTKSYRSVLESRHGPEKGTVISLDYKSLEPRVLLCVSGTQPRGGMGRDIYEQIRSDLFAHVGGSKITRDTVKGIVLSEMFGAGIESLQRRLPEVGDLPRIVEEIGGWFGLPELKERLRLNWLENDRRFIENYYGRRVRTDSQHTLISHYVQSTAVDVTLLGFLQILEYLDSINMLDEVVPLFILHDALVLDVKNTVDFSLVAGLAKIGSIDIKGFEDTVFHMTIDREFTTNKEHTAHQP